MIDETRVKLYQNDIITFAEELYYLAPNQPIKLWDAQKKILRDCTERNKDGMFKHKISVISLPRQNFKSEIACILGMHSLFFEGYGTELLSVGIGGKDTGKVIFRKARRCIQNSPALYDSIGDKNFLKSEITVPVLESSWQIAASEVLSTIGRSFSLILLDELGMERIGLNEGVELYDSLTAGQASKPNARIVCTSTVGGEQGKLYDLIQLSKTDKKVYCFLSHENLSPLITKEYLERRKLELHPAVYKHWHENQFFSGADSFISPELYDSCVDPLIAPVHLMPKDTPTICWVDLGIKKDPTVAVTIFRDKDNKTRVAEIKSWVPADLKQDIQLAWVESYLIEAKDRLNIKQIYIDQYQAQSLIQRYGKKLNIMGIHLTSKLLEQIWANWIALMQNGDVKLYNDRSTDCLMLRREALNLTIAARGSGFKVSDPGSTHQDRILALAGAAWKMVEKYESAKYTLGWFSCYLKIDHCPLIDVEAHGFATGCGSCPHFIYGYDIFLKSEGKKKAGIGIYSEFSNFKMFVEKIGGFHAPSGQINY